MNFDASNPDTDSVQCAVCEKLITAGHWFSRISHGDYVVALCCPLCTDVFQSNSQPYIRRIQTLSLLQTGGGSFRDATPQLPPSPP